MRLVAHEDLKLLIGREGGGRAALLGVFNLRAQLGVVKRHAWGLDDFFGRWELGKCKVLETGFRFGAGTRGGLTLDDGRLLRMC